MRWMKTAPPQGPWSPLPRRQISWRSWLLIIGYGRIGAPIAAVLLLYTTREQIGYIIEREHLWLNVPVLLIGLFGIAMNCRTIFTAWHDWTWQGHLRESVVRKAMERRRPDR